MSKAEYPSVSLCHLVSMQEEGLLELLLCQLVFLLKFAVLQVPHITLIL